MFNVERARDELESGIAGVFAILNRCEYEVDRLGDTRVNTRNKLKDARARIDDVLDNLSVADAVVDEDGALQERLEAVRDELNEAIKYANDAERHVGLAMDRFHNTEIFLGDALSAANDARDLLN